MAQTVLKEFYQILSAQAFPTVFRDSFRPEVVSDVIYGADVEQVNVNVRVKLGDSRSNRSREIRLPHFMTDEQRRQPTQLIT